MRWPLLPQPTLAAPPCRPARSSLKQRRRNGCCRKSSSLRARKGCKAGMLTDTTPTATILPNRRAAGAMAERADGTAPGHTDSRTLSSPAAGQARLSGAAALFVRLDSPEGKQVSCPLLMTGEAASVSSSIPPLPSRKHRANGRFTFQAPDGVVVRPFPFNGLACRPASPGWGCRVFRGPSVASPAACRCGLRALQACGPLRCGTPFYI